jgi:hypothetical protein
VPWAARPSANALPTPLLEPVTTAIWSVSVVTGNVPWIVLLPPQLSLLYCRRERFLQEVVCEQGVCRRLNGRKLQS